MLVGVNVGVIVKDRVGVCVPVIVGVGVRVGVRVGLPVGERVGVRDGVRVELTLGVALSVAVGDIGLGQLPLQSPNRTARKSWLTALPFNEPYSIAPFSNSPGGALGWGGIGVWPAVGCGVGR